MDFENTITFMLTRAATSHRTLLEKAVKKAGLFGGQALVLIELWSRDGQRQVDLAKNLNVTATTINKILGGLVSNDFVTRERYEDDNRSTRIFLTAKGFSVRKDLEQQWKEVEAHSVAGFSEAEKMMLRDFLARLMANNF